MHLKTASHIAAFIVLLSIPLALAGQGLLYAPTLIEHFHWSNALSMAVGLVTTLLLSGGLLVFLLAYRHSAACQSGHSKHLFLLAGGLVGCSALITALYCVPSIIALSEHVAGFRYSVYLISTIAALAWQVSLCVFIFSQAGPAPSVKAPAAIALAAGVMMCGTMLLNMVIFRFWEYPSITMIGGTLLATLAFCAETFAALFFLLMFLMIPSEPGAAATDSALESAL